jgi:hypothetical protein
VNYRVLNGEIVFRTGNGQAAAAVRQPRVSFEADRFDDALAEGGASWPAARPAWSPPARNWTR